jgi:osmotically-inducible protein OsmY
MTPKLKAILSLCLVFALFAGCAFAGKKMDLSDGAIQDMVMRRLANDPDVRGAGLKIEVADGVVTLSGMVAEEKHKARAEKLAKKVRGVKQVVNKLTVGRAG